MKAILSIALLASVAVYVQSIPSHNRSGRAEEMWISQIEHGNAAFNDRPLDYQVYRNVMDFGCAADGVTDDTACIQTAISAGGRCGENCGSSTVFPAIIYFPSGQYLISQPIVMWYFSQLIGNANDPPTLIAAPSFTGMGLLDSDPYVAGGGQWYTNQNNFFRQVRNFKIDLTRTPASAATTGIHWQVAQATSLVNIEFIMSTEPGNNHQGIWMENGSGGFMSDLTFNGGRYGMWVGNQQFLSRNLIFNDCDTAVYMNWNWQWTFKEIQINNCNLGIDMSAPSDVKASGVGSILLLDSSITNTQYGVKTIGNPNPVQDTSGTLLLDNVQLTGVGAAVVDENMGTILPGGTTKIAAWGRGSRYTDGSGQGEFVQEFLPNVEKSASLLDGNGNFFSKSRPQYETLSVNDFASVRTYGAAGDGVSDDSDALQQAIDDNVNGKVVFIPHGAYVITKTVTIPSGVRIIGELWSILMANGPNFQDEQNPQPMIRVGSPGEVGTVEITDIMFSTKGANPGAILVEWNMKGSSPGAAGMWDSHFRVGGFAGSELQFSQCPKGQGAVPQCISAHMLLHLTSTSSALLENVWAWTGDHDLDNGLAQSQISIYTGRGVLVEGSGPNWLYGTQSEHNVLYQYQLSAASNVFLTMIQSETPYWQPGPKAPSPFMFVNADYDDPSYDHCDPASVTCAMSWALRAHSSSYVYLYGAGLYNFFNNYDQTCLDFENCQDAQVDLEGNSNFYIFNLNTKAARNMVVTNRDQVWATHADNANTFCATINAFLTEV